MRNIPLIAIAVMLASVTVAACNSSDTTADPSAAGRFNTSSDMTTLAQWVKANGYGGVMIYTISADAVTGGKALQAVYDVFHP